ncbi:MAG: damage-inducible protein DinB [Acidobacteria bacterium]|nr:damage-inducible protein DinB [Acidobacteriota bacterium]
MSIAQSLVAELAREAATTHRVLERVPADKLAWGPHAKSMSLGALALHVANIPGAIAKMSQSVVFDMTIPAAAAAAASAEEVLKAHDEAIARATAIVGAYSDDQLMEKWTWRTGGKTLMTLPRVGLLRTVMLNHWYHHRGQLSVYLRLLDVPVPSIYGPSADENPFA